MFYLTICHQIGHPEQECGRVKKVWRQVVKKSDQALGPDAATSSAKQERNLDKHPEEVVILWQCQKANESFQASSTKKVPEEEATPSKGSKDVSHLSGKGGVKFGSEFDVEVSNSYSALFDDQNKENLPSTRIRKPTQKAQEAKNQVKKKKGSGGGTLLYLNDFILEY